MRRICFLSIYTLILLCAGYQTSLAQDSLNVSRVGELYSFWDTAHELVVSGNYAYVATGESGLKIVDISDSSAIVEIGDFESSGGEVWDVTLWGNYALLAAGEAGLWVLDVTDPTNPIRVGACQLPGCAYNVAASGAYAYVAADWGGLRVISLADPTLPMEVGFCNYEAPERVTIAGQYAYATDWEYGLIIYDISNPSVPTVQGNYPCDYVRNFALAGNYAYLLKVDESPATGNGPTILQVVDVSNPLNPQSVATDLLSSHESFDIEASGNEVYITNADLGLMIVDVTNPVAPVLAGSCAEGHPNGLFISDSHAYLGCGTDYPNSGGLAIADVTNPSAPVMETIFDRGGWIYSVAAQGRYVYAVLSDGTLRVIDITNPTVPQEIGRFQSGRIRSIAVAGNYGYAASFHSFQVLDISNPQELEVVGVIDSLPCSSVEIWGNHAYVVTDDYAPVVIDVSVPTVPQIIGYAPISWDGYQLAAWGNYVYRIANEGTGDLEVLSVDNPSHPEILGSCPLSLMADIAVASDGQNVYAAMGSPSLKVVNLSRPESPQIVGTFETPTSAFQVCTYANYAFVQTWGGLRVVDVSNPCAPYEVGFYEANIGFVWGHHRVARSGSVVIVAEASHLGFYDCSASMTPINFALTPLNPPLVVPANGGSFNFIASMANSGPRQTPFTIWTRIKNPDGSYTAPLLGPLTLDPPVGMVLSRMRTQAIPASWAAGTYTYLGYANLVYTYPASDSSSFIFTKSPAAGDGPWISDASCTGEPFPGERLQTAFIPSGLDLGVSPNPFNPTTAISYKLQATSQISLQVYDTAGRLVSTLVDGMQPAGTHQATFDGSKLASGLYFVRMQAGGYSAMQKMVLIK